VVAETPRIDNLSKNLVINGGMDFFQRSDPTAGEAMTGSGTLEYIAPDRFRVASNGAADTGTVERAISSPDTKTKYSLQMTLNADNLTDELIFEQRIEAANIREFAGEKFNFGFQVFSNSATSVELEIFTANIEDDFSAQTSVHTDTTTISTGAWERVTFENIGLSSSASRGVAIRVTLTSMSVTGLSKDHFITQVVASGLTTSLSNFTLAGRNITEEFQSCLRYYEKSLGKGFKPGTDNPQGASFGIAANTSEIVWNKRWAVEKRAIPTVTIYSKAGTVGAVTFTDTFAEIATLNAAHIGTTQVRYVVRPSTGLVKGNGYLWHYTADAEL
jgi:hypothetical protein